MGDAGAAVPPPLRGAGVPAIAEGSKVEAGRLTLEPNGFVLTPIVGMVEVADLAPQIHASA